MKKIKTPVNLQNAFLKFRIGAKLSCGTSGKTVNHSSSRRAELRYSIAVYITTCNPDNRVISLQKTWGYAEKLLCSRMLP